MNSWLNLLGIATISALLSVVPPEPSASAERIKVEFSKSQASGSHGLQYEYRFKVMDAATSEPITGAKFEIATDMPSMPGAHHMPHIPALPAGSPGEYSARINFDMGGVWTLVLRFSEPRRDIITLSDTAGSEHKAGMHGDVQHKSHHQTPGK